MSAYRVSGQEKAADVPRQVASAPSLQTIVKELAIPFLLFVTFVLATLAPHPICVVLLLYIAFLLVPAIVATIQVIKNARSRRRVQEDVEVEPAARVRVAVEPTGEEHEAEDGSTLASVARLRQVPPSC